MSGERDLNHETKAMLPDALRKVSGLYIGEVMQDALVADGALDALDQEQRDVMWKQSADLFPPFRYRIIGLRLAINNARQAYDKEGEVLRDVVESRFESAGDLGVRHFLTTLLCSRATIAQATVDGSILLTVEAEAMKKELGVIPGIKGLELETMSFNRVVEAVLTGKLQLSRQTQTPTD